MNQPIDYDKILEEMERPHCEVMQEWNKAHRKYKRKKLIINILWGILAFFLGIGWGYLNNLNCPC
jgi:hypothetical protein